QTVCEFCDRAGIHSPTPSSVYGLYPVDLLVDLEALDTALGFLHVQQQSIAVTGSFWLIAHKGEAGLSLRAGEGGLAISVDHTPQALPVVDLSRIRHGTVTHRVALYGLMNIFETAIDRRSHVLRCYIAFLTTKDRPRDFAKKSWFVLVLPGLCQAPGPCCW